MLSSLKARLNGLMLRFVYASQPLEYKTYDNPENIGFKGWYETKDAGRPVAFVEHASSRLVFDWCDYNWFSLGRAR